MFRRLYFLTFFAVAVGNAFVFKCDLLENCLLMVNLLDLLLRFLHCTCFIVVLGGDWKSFKGLPVGPLCKNGLLNVGIEADGLRDSVPWLRSGLLVGLPPQLPLVAVVLENSNFHLLLDQIPVDALSGGLHYVVNDDRRILLLFSRGGLFLRDQLLGHRCVHPIFLNNVQQFEHDLFVEAVGGGHRRSHHLSIERCGVHWFVEGEDGLYFIWGVVLHRRSLHFLRLLFGTVSVLDTMKFTFFESYELLSNFALKPNSLLLGA